MIRTLIVLATLFTAPAFANGPSCGHHELNSPNACRADGESCQRDGDCCTSRCNVNGVCGTESFCHRDGESCGSDSDCCSNHCTAYGSCG